MLNPENTVNTIHTVLENRGLAPLFSGYKLMHTDHGTSWLFAILDDRKIAKIENYTNPKVLHQISTALDGAPVILSNHSGIRFAVLVSDKPELSQIVEYPGFERGIFQIGDNLSGKISTDWDSLGHILVSGMTGSGKSVFLRLLVKQAISEGFKLALGDPDGRTFPAIRDIDNLITPIAAGIDECEHLLNSVWHELQRRKELLETTTYADIGEYNKYNDPVPRLLVVIDEYNGLVSAQGGKGSEFSKSITRLAWLARKFYITLVLAGQDFTKDIVGPVRDQMMTRLCFAVDKRTTSHVVVGKSGAEKIKTPGRALTNRWGIVQTYYTDLSEIDLGDGITNTERDLAARIIDNYNGRLTETALMEIGYSQRDARALRNNWKDRGLAKKVPEKSNALCIVADKF